MGFPMTRMRRLRKTHNLRSLTAETKLNRSDFILPLFIRAGEKIRNPVPPMPEVNQLSIDMALEECRTAMGEGVSGAILFGIPETKDAEGSAAWDPSGIIPSAVRTIKAALPDFIVITDVCLCEYTSHGHCGILKGNTVDNDATLEVLAKESLAHADAGADIVAPSDMMDGRVKYIREALDNRGFTELPIMSYSAKFASAFYGPFRAAAESSPQFGDRKSYQMQPSNRREAMREIELDINEGADIVMVKPAMPCLDIIREARSRFDLPIAAYQVSGEYSMIMAAAEKGWIDLESAMMESLLSIKRAGADIIITYFARKAAGKLK